MQVPEGGPAPRFREEHRIPCIRRMRFPEEGEHTIVGGDRADGFRRMRFAEEGAHTCLCREYRRAGIPLVLLRKVRRRSGQQEVFVQERGAVRQGRKRSDLRIQAGAQRGVRHTRWSEGDRRLCAVLVRAFEGGPHTIIGRRDRGVLIRGVRIRQVHRRSGQRMLQVRRREADEEGRRSVFPGMPGMRRSLYRML